MIIKNEKKKEHKCEWGSFLCDADKCEIGFDYYDNYDLSWQVKNVINCGKFVNLRF